MAQKISPVTLWVNGESKSAQYLQVTGINDNYESSAGDVYYDSTSNKLRCYNGTSWNDLF